MWKEDIEKIFIYIVKYPIRSFIMSTAISIIISCIAFFEPNSFYYYIHLIVIWLEDIISGTSHLSDLLTSEQKKLIKQCCEPCVKENISVVSKFDSLDPDIIEKVKQHDSSSYTRFKNSIRSWLNQIFSSDIKLKSEIPGVSEEDIKLIRKYNELAKEDRIVARTCEKVNTLFDKKSCFENWKSKK